MQRNKSGFAAAIVMLFLSLPVSAVPDSSLWGFWASHDEASLIQPDHGIWQSILERFVIEHEDGINRVAYSQLLATGADAELDTYLEKMTALDPRDLNQASQMAYWINLYNALTVRVVLNNPKKKTILRMGQKLFSIGPWDDPVTTIAGQSLTLNDIEHRILRPIWQDHRIHFAVNCASIGCPNLVRTAYTSRNLEALLQQSETDYLNHPRGVDQLKNGKLQLSSIFKWYQSDFGVDKNAVVNYIKRHSNRIAEVEVARKPRVSYEYDWGLNSHIER